MLTYSKEELYSVDQVKMQLQIPDAFDQHYLSVDGIHIGAALAVKVEISCLRRFDCKARIL